MYDVSRQSDPKEYYNFVSFCIYIKGRMAYVYIVRKAMEGFVQTAQVLVGDQSFYLLLMPLW